MKKFFIIPILLFSFFIFNISNVKALTTTGVLANSTGNNYININDQVQIGNYYGDNRPYFKGYGEGNVIFSILTSNQTAVVDQITEVMVSNSNDIFTCDIGNNTSYYDSQTERILYTVNCPVNFPSGRGLDRIRIVRGDKYGILKVNFSQYITFVSKDNVVDVSSIVNAISSQTNSLISNNNTNTTQIINNINNVYTKVNSILSSIDSTNSKLEDIKSKLDQQKQDNDEWKNTDLDNSTKQSPDTTDYNNYQSAENNLFGKMEYADTNSLNISTDSNTLSWIWSTIISFYNSNPLLMNFVISILSIGIIKMALGR